MSSLGSTEGGGNFFLAKHCDLGHRLLGGGEQAHFLSILDTDTMAQQARTLEETWSECQGPFKRVLSDLLVGMDRKKYMDLYTYDHFAVVCCLLLYVTKSCEYRLVFKYVCSPNAETEELYNRVVQLFRARAAELVKVCFVVLECAPMSFVLLRVA